MRSRALGSTTAAGWCRQVRRPFRRGRRGAVVGLLAGSLLLLAGCGSQPAASPRTPRTTAASAPSSGSAAATKSAAPGTAGGGSASGALTPVRIAVLSKSVGFGFLYVARDLGLFKQQGLDAQIVTMKPNASEAALTQGKVDFSAAIGLAVIAAQHGLPLQVVFVSRNHPLEVLIAPDSVASVNALRGRTIGVGAPLQSPVVAEVTAMLQADHLPASGYHFLYGGNDRAVAALLTAHRIAAGAVNVVFALPLLQAGYHILASSISAIDYPDGGLATSTSEAASHASVVRRTVLAAQEATRLLASDQARVLPVFEKEFHYSPAAAGQLFKLIQPTWSPSGTPSAAALKFEFATNHRLFHLPVPTNDSRYFDTAFVTGGTGSTPS